jgi:hypothetical protein
MSGTIDPETPLTVTLAARQWNMAFAAMNEGIATMAGVMRDMQRQCMMQQDRHYPPPDFSAARPNGEIHEDAHG